MTKGQGYVNVVTKDTLWVRRNAAKVAFLCLSFSSDILGKIHHSISARCLMFLRGREPDSLPAFTLLTFWSFSITLIIEIRCFVTPDLEPPVVGIWSADGRLFLVKLGPATARGSLPPDAGFPSLSHRRKSTQVDQGL